MAQQRPVVPKFGNWDSENIGFTAVFDKVRDGRTTGTNTATPTYPKANQSPNLPEKFSKEPKFREKEHNSVTNDQYAVKEYSKQRVRKSSDPHGCVENYAPNNPRRANVDQKRNRNNKDNIYNSDRSAKKSQHYQDHRSDSSATNSGYSASKVATHKRAASVPKFGGWNETNPQAGEGYTVVFAKIKEEKVSATTKRPNIPVEKVCLTEKEITKTHTSCMGKILNCLFPRVRE